MSKIIFVSNRLPVTVQKKEACLEYNRSIGGLATGLKSYHQQAESIWIGWPGIIEEELSSEQRTAVQKELKEQYKCFPVFLTKEDNEQYYNGFCNRTIWPLFHYFAGKAEYDFASWQAYRRVNEKFFKNIKMHIEENDTIWIHDYQLMLLPKMIKEEYPDTKIGFFLHIPFPSYEIFRLLIWREEIIHGLLGADLIGFHTFEYVRHFLSCTRRLLGLVDSMNKISYETRNVQVDAFPMGIDYKFFSREEVKRIVKGEAKDVKNIIKGVEDIKTILSVDRLDYTKGIPERLRAFERFLTNNPQYHEKVRMNLIIAPSRADIDMYDQLRKEIAELVGEINGKYATFTWIPVWYFYRSFSQKSLIQLYRHSDVLLATPLRDGMNLVVKEYIASRNDYKGMLVISETAGAASELGEAVIVNPNDPRAIAEGIKIALDMDPEEKDGRNRMMHRRISRYNVQFWAEDFLSTLERSAVDSDRIANRNLKRDIQKIEEDYINSSHRAIFLDYDGTLVGFRMIPDEAKPDDELKKLIYELASDKKNTVVLISGRDKDILARWFGEFNIHIISAHGLWIYYPAKREWVMTINLENHWKDTLRTTLELYVDRIPGSFLEEKEHSLALHYRKCDPDMVSNKINEARETVLSLIRSTTLGIQEGNKVLEIKDSRIDKGFAASVLIKEREYDFLFAAGDDLTDEDLFSALPEGAYTVKIGAEKTSARYYLRSWLDTRDILNKFIGLSRIDS